MLPMLLTMDIACTALLLLLLLLPADAPSHSPAR
jgi:hypothetical protein